MIVNLRLSLTTSWHGATDATLAALEPAGQAVRTKGTHMWVFGPVGGCARAGRGHARAAAIGRRRVLRRWRTASWPGRGRAVGELWGRREGGSKASSPSRWKRATRQLIQLWETP